MRISKKLVLWSSFPLVAVTGALLSVVTVQTVKADLLAYEGFNYAEGTGIGGQAGGFGWAGGWATGGNNVYGTNVTGSLGYMDSFGNMLQTEGGSLLVGREGGAATPNRTLGSFMSGLDTYNTLSNGTYWISFLAQRVGPTNSTPPYYSRQANLSLLQTSNERLSVGRPNTNSFTGTPYDTWSLWHVNGLAATPGGTGTAQPSDYPLNSPDGASFLLLKVVTDGTTAGGDTTYLWVNWTDLMSEPAISTATLTNAGLVNLDGINNLRLMANGFSGSATNALMLVDELRVGTSFLSVAVPEPSLLALFGIGTLLLILRLKRR